jgi:hypothetical protein
MRALLLMSVAFIACNKENPDFCPAHPGEDGCPGMRIDGGPDDAIDAPDGDNGIDARACYGADNYEVCLATVPMSPLTMPATFDTNMGNTMCLAAQPAGWVSRGQPASCFVVGTDITINTTNVTGSRPLVVLATKTLTVNGVLDVASHGGTAPKTGPGAPFLNCQGFTATPTSSSSGGAGGAGANFMTRGGAGGDGNGGMAGNSGGTTPTVAGGPPTALRAGCTGQAGGDGDGSSGGVGGAGGGALYLLAGMSITIGNAGIINASGAGGGAGGDQAGGGGGGSGGMIVLHAPTISAANGRLLANGGGGASGGNNGGGVAGNDPPPTTPQTGAAVIQGPSSCCAGGAGYSITAPATAGTPGGSGLSGGAGGGGGGYIQASMSLGTANVSPAATTP